VAAAAAAVLLGRIACIVQTWPVATDAARSVVCLSVCLCVDHTDVTCKKRLNRLRCRLEEGLIRVCPKNQALDGVENFGALSGKLKNTGSRGCGVRSKMIIQSSITAWQQTSTLLTAGLHASHYTVPVKSPPPAMRPFVKIL